MDRRNFIKCLAGLPLVGLLARELTSSPKGHAVVSDVEAKQYQSVNGWLDHEFGKQEGVITSFALYNDGYPEGKLIAVHEFDTPITVSDGDTIEGAFKIRLT